MRNPSALRPTANGFPPNSFVIRHTKTSVTAPASAGRMCHAVSDSPNSVLLKAASRGTSGGKSTYPNARCLLSAMV